MPRIRLVWFSLLAIAFAGCSSAVGNPTPTYGASATSAPAATASVTFTVSPGSGAASSRRRRPAYLSPATRSVSILPVVAGEPNQQAAVIDIAAGASGCAGSGASLACSGTVTAPVGETSFTVTSYGDSAAQGAVLSVGTITVDVKDGSSSRISNATSLTLSGVPASFALSISPKTLTIGTSSTLTAIVTSYDASGATIVGPGSYTTGIDLETIVAYNDEDDAVLTSTAPAPFVPGCTYPTTPMETLCNLVTVAIAPSQKIELAYSGEFVMGTSIVLAGESPGLKTQSVVIPFASPPAHGGCTGSAVEVCPGEVTFASSASSPVPLTVTESGIGTFTVTDYACVDNNVASINFQKMTSGDAFTAYPGNTAGSCQATFTDPHGDSTILNITLLSAGPSPSPSPSASPTPAPTPTPSEPSPIEITPSGPIEFASSKAAAQTIEASETGTSAFTVDASACAGVVNVTPQAGSSFTIAPVPALVKGGKCTLAVHDPALQTADVTVLVDGVSFTVNAK